MYEEHEFSMLNTLAVTHQATSPQQPTSDQLVSTADLLTQEQLTRVSGLFLRMLTAQKTDIISYYIYLEPEDQAL